MEERRPCAVTRWRMAGMRVKKRLRGKKNLTGCMNCMKVAQICLFLRQCSGRTRSAFGTRPHCGWNRQDDGRLEQPPDRRAGMVVA